MFSTGLTAYDSGNHFHFAIVKEDKVLANTHAYTASSYDACSVTIVTDCNRGEDVWVANKQGDTRSITGDQAGVNHFTGFEIN